MKVFFECAIRREGLAGNKSLFFNADDEAAKIGVFDHVLESF